MTSKVQRIRQEIGVKIKNVESVSKSKRKKTDGIKMEKSEEKNAKPESINNTKTRAIVEGNWECHSETINDIIQLRRHMWQVNCN